MFKTQVANGLKWQAINIVGKQILSFVVVTTLARLLEPSAFGLFALIGVYLGFVTMFVDQGIGMSLIQRQDLQPGHMDAAFWFNLSCAAILCMGTMALAAPLSLLFKEPQLASLLRWSSLGLVIGASSEIHATLFVKMMHFRPPVIRALIASATGGSVGVGMALAHCGVWSLVGQQLAEATAGAIFLWCTSTYRPALKFSWPHFRELFGFSSSVFTTSILWYFWTRLDQVVIARFAGTSAVGLYMIAGKIPNMANTMTGQPLTVVSLPSISRLQNDRVKMQQVISQGMELNAIISFAVFVGLAAVASDLVPILFGAKWAASAVLCSLLSLNSLILAIQVFIYPVLLATGGIGKYVWLNVCQAIGVLLACLIGIQFGVVDLVIGLIASSLVNAIPALLFVRHRIGLSPLNYCKPCLVPALASIFMVGLIWLTVVILPPETIPMLRLACKIAIGGVGYLGCILFLDPSSLRRLADMVGHAFRKTEFTTDSSITSQP